MFSLTLQTTTNSMKFKYKSFSLKFSDIILLSRVARSLSILVHLWPGRAAHRHIYVYGAAGTPARRFVYKMSEWGMGSASQRFSLMIDGRRPAVICELSKTFIMKRQSKPSGAAFRKRRKEEEEKRAQSRGMFNLHNDIT